MSLESYLAELQDPNCEVTTVDLAQLSGLMPDEQSELQEAWSGISPLRRLEIMGHLVEMADDNAEFDFGAVFCHALHDEEPMVREQAVSGLWESEDRRLIPQLVERLEQDVEDQVRASAAQVLGHFAVLADSGKLVKRDAERVYHALMSALDDEDEPLLVRRRALESVAPFRVPEVRGWVQWAFDHPESMMRQSALYAMGRTGDGAWLPVVYGEMESDDPAMRYEAANAARKLGDQESIPYLAELINDFDSQVSLAALHAIGVIGGARARALLRRLAVEGDDQVVREAAEEVLAIMEADSDDFSMLRADPD